MNLPKGYGYTTGTCAQAASKAAVLGLILGEIPEKIDVLTPNNTKLSLNVLNRKINYDFSICAIKKFSGDDPDVTNGLLIFVKARKISKKAVLIRSGQGVGTVTKDGLALKVGQPAINLTPLRVIKADVLELLEKYDCDFGVELSISVPNGEEIAKKTYNPRLGIVGGISIIGTSGIVEPMSTKAIIDTIKVEMNMLKTQGVTDIIITPGNYGKDYINANLADEKAIKCSNFLGDALDLAQELSFSSVLLIGHIGKFIKVASGIFNTHSNNADARLETLVSACVKADVPYEILKKVLNSLTTEKAVEILFNSGFLDETMKFVALNFEFHLKNRYNGNIAFGIFSNNYGLISKSENFDEILKRW